jgi:hypothetical protein
MNITSQEITWTAFKFSRREVKGFSYEKEIFHIHLSGNQKITLGHNKNSWPFTLGAQVNSRPLPHLIYDEYRFLPEHVLAYYDDPAEDAIRVFTALGEFTVPRSLAQTFAVMQVRPEYQNSVASDWIAAYNRHRTDPFGI